MALAMTYSGYADLQIYPMNRDHRPSLCQYRIVITLTKCATGLEAILADANSSPGAPESEVVGSRDVSQVGDQCSRPSIVA